MKRNVWLICFLSTSLLAQQPTNNPAPSPAGTPAAVPALTNAASSAAANTNAPDVKTEAKKKKKKSAKPVARKKELGADLKSVPLVAGPALVIASNVNVRGQAGLKGEVVARLAKEQP